MQAHASLEARQLEGCTALSLAAYAGYATVVRALLQASSDVDARSAGGLTPLMLASVRGTGQNEPPR